MITQPYLEQLATWPSSDRHILAQYDEETIVVYQAYSHEIADYAVQNQQFGGKFSFDRMSWIKPNFLWMMYRSGWAEKPGQERILAVRLKRAFFDEILQFSVNSVFDNSVYSSEEEWKKAVQSSDVRLQWDPDHDPVGNKVERRAIQLGLRGNTLQRYGREEIVSIQDITEFVKIQKEHCKDGYTYLETPAERIYSILS